jgi:glucose-1-phosphate thymidylyltransferase
MEGGRVVEIVEKPKVAPSRLAVTGCYCFDPRVFEIIDGLTPSRRGELEITDVNNRYVAWGQMKHHVLEGWWTDAGTVASLHRAANLVAGERDNPVLGGFRVSPRESGP